VLNVYCDLVHDVTLHRTSLQLLIMLVLWAGAPADAQREEDGRGPT
jgi:hypothetical protein